MITAHLAAKADVHAADNVRVGEGPLGAWGAEGVGHYATVLVWTLKLAVVEGPPP